MRIGPSTSVEVIPPFPIILSFIHSHNITRFLRREYLNELGTLELVVVGLYERSKKQFILIVADDMDCVHTFVFHHEFFTQYK
jgi:hypothetical protein